MCSIAAACIFFSTVLAFGQSERPAREAASRILALENAWNQAEVKQDARAMDLLLADDFVYVDEDGSSKTKGQWLAQVKSGADHYEQLSNSGMRVRLFGDVAVVTGQYHERLRVGGKVVVHSGRFTDLWIQQAGQWKCISSQSTLMTP